MPVARRERIERIVKALEEQMRALKAIGLNDCASLVRIAWLDLRRRNDHISIRELQALCDRVTDDPLDASPPARAAATRKAKTPGAPQGKKTSAAKPPAAAKRRKKTAHIIDMQAWRSRIPRSSS